IPYIKERREYHVRAVRSINSDETITRSSDQLGIEGQARVHRHVETVNRHHERLWSVFMQVTNGLTLDAVDNCRIGGIRINLAA
ncbi:hypothetical protein EJB05_49277, partial [Eragrostis curvula]